MRALVADDDPENREILRRMLAHIGWDCDTANDGKAAAEMALAGAYDAILLDLFMPGMDGFEAARRIRAAGSSVPLLSVSGAEEDAKALKSGFDRTIQKPYTLGTLREVLKDIRKFE